MPRQSKWRVFVHLTAFLTAAVGLYTLLGFLVLPWWIARKIPELGEGRAARFSVEDVSANPFLLTLTARGLEIAQQDGTPVLRVPQLTLDLGLASLIERALVVQRIEAREPRLSLVLDPEGRLNVVELFRSTGPPPAQSTSTDAKAAEGLPPILLQAAVIDAGGIEYVDRARPQPRRLELAPITLRADGLTTRAEGSGRVRLDVGVAGSGSISAQGTLVLQPLGSEGSVRIERLPLTPVLALAMTDGTIGPPAGRLDLAFGYRVSTRAGETPGSLAGVTGTVADFALQAAGSDAPLVAWSRLAIGGGSVDLANNAVALETLDLREARVRVRADSQGRLDLMEIAEVFGRGEGAEPESATEPWRVQIGAVQAQASGLSYTDERPGFPFEAEVGEADLRFALDAAFGEAAKVRAHDLALSLQEIRVRAPGSEEPMTASTLQVEGAAVDTGAQRIAAQAVTLAGARVDVVRGENGRITLAGLALPTPDAMPAGQDATAPAGSTEALPWAYDIGTVRIDDLSLALADRSYRDPIAYALALDAALTSLSSDAAKPVGITAAVQVAQGGAIRAEGTASQDFSAATVRLSVDALALAPLDPLLAEFALLEIASGTASANAQLRFGPPAGGSRILLEGELSIADVLVNETGNGKPFVSWRRIEARDTTLGVEPNRLEIGQLSVVAPEAELIVSEKRTLNLGRIVRERPGEARDAAAGGDAFPMRIGRILFEQGRLRFADLSLVLPFSTQVHTLEGVIVGFSSAPDARAELQLDGLIADYGSASASGALNAFDPTRFMDIGVRFDNVQIPPFSPYTATFAGRTIESGRLWLDLEYRISDDKLSGENRIVVQNLELGERVEAPGAADWPLDLALALLKDSNGRINMEIPVSGDVGDPKFDYGQLIRNAIGGALRNIVSAPFRALAGLFGAGTDAEQMRRIEFNPGSAQLQPAQQQQLAEVAKALQARPELRLIVHAPYDPVQDGRALREQAVRRAVAEALGRVSAPDAVPDPIAFTDPQTQRALEALLRERLSEEDRKIFASIIGPSDPDYYHAIFGELAARVEVPESALRSLAASRAQAVARALVESGIDAARVAPGEARSIDQPAPAAIAATLDLTAGPTG